MSNEINNTNTTNTQATSTTLNNITIINIKNENNLQTVNSLRSKLGNNVDNFNILPYQSGAALVQFKFHKDNRRLFIEYPAFLATITPDYINLFLKKVGEPFPSICYKVKKNQVAEKVTNNEILNGYINIKVNDVVTFLESELTNESKVVMDNLEISVLLRILEKEKLEGGKYTYSRVFDLIRSKINESKDCGYLEKLCKTCVMLNATFADASILNFSAIDLFPKEEKQPKAKAAKEPKAPKETKVKETTTKKTATKVTEEKLETAIAKAKEEQVIKEETKAIIQESEVIKQFINPTEVPVLENIETESKYEPVVINEDLVNSIIDSI